ncbi:hypothetical protein [Polaromonas aquatica]|uniref:hypothetical protein n=1 Tax=Polaromonas aquatica TaxID=332657 RepID=UPI00366ACD27
MHLSSFLKARAPGTPLSFVNQNFHPAKATSSARAITAHQAVENSPTLARLAELVRESSARLEAIESLIPETLRPAVKAGPIDGETWCLLVNGNAAAAKLRQLTPLIQSRLLGKGWKVTSIRLKILIAKK